MDKQLTHPLRLAGTGVTTDKFTPLNALIMSLTVLLYLIIQVNLFDVRTMHGPCS